MNGDVVSFHLRSEDCTNFPQRKIMREQERRTNLHLLVAIAMTLACSTAEAGLWDVPPVRQTNGAAAPVEMPYKAWIVTAPWVRVTAQPFMVYMPEKHRLLILMEVDYPHQSAVTWSDDYGATWSEPKYMQPPKYRNPAAYDDGLALTYLGGGRLICLNQYDCPNWKNRSFYSSDYGESWDNPIPVPPATTDKSFNSWDPYLVEKDSKTGKITLTATGYHCKGDVASGGEAMAFIRTSADVGKTWTNALQPPQWVGVNEVALCRAKNGDIVGACRTVVPEKYKYELDHYEGLGVSVSKDNGKTWSHVKKLYDWGRHHPSMVVLPNGEMLMTYVVRRGYTDDAGGMPRFGVEALVSRDNGQSWDLDHRYLLVVSSGNRKRENNKQFGGDWWQASTQMTASVLLPDGSILTAFGTGFRIQMVKVNWIQEYMGAPRDVGLVRWRVNEKGGLNSDTTISDAPFDSDLRNLFDPTTGKPAATIPH
jgi:hypothetical protein